MNSLLQGYRKSKQRVLPAYKRSAANGRYDLYPAFSIGPGKIELGYDALADVLAHAQRVTLDGYVGVLWEHFREQLEAALARRGVRAVWWKIEHALREEDELERRIAPFLGGDDPLFGTRFTGTLRDFFDPAKLARIQPDAHAELNIVYGCGAALAGWTGTLVYVDLPKNEIQYRARAGSITNLGARRASHPKAMYKRMYFVDWVALNRHKAELAARVDWIVDEQRPAEPALARGDTLRAALDAMSANYFRVRPWFEPGPWGGQWLKQHIPDLAQDEPNYAWSFELIAPENGLLLESGGRLLEVSFDWLMYRAARAVLGKSADLFGYEFPIRFDYLDTFDGGNLSVQCHPRPEYMRRHFGERLTQDETYYILDCKPGARVWLGFQDESDPAALRRALQASAETGRRVEVERFVHTEPAHKHDLFLIPHGTIHASGANNLVLEISATPYIFTFKMYDWQRLDLDGKPRTLNIGRAFENLDFSRAGARVAAELVAQPRVLERSADGQLVHLPTHPKHFYDVHRFEFRAQVSAATEGACHVLNVVEGERVILETANGGRQEFHYAETFVVPAAAERYVLRNAGKGEVKVVKAFVKDGGGS